MTNETAPKRIWVETGVHSDRVCEHGEYGGTRYIRADISEIRTERVIAELEAAQAEIQRCHERLEITHEFKMSAESSGLERVEIPYEKRQKKPDGIECRDATIALLEQSNKAAQARIAELEGENWRLKREVSHQKMVDKCGDTIGGFDHEALKGDTQ